MDNDIIINKRYQLGRKLGQGTWGITREALDLVTGSIVAIKIVKKKEIKKEETLLREANIMKLCDHPNIVKCFDFMKDNENYYIVMECIKYGELFDYVTSGNVKFTQAKEITGQLISAVEYCHGNLIAHRDLKLENLLVSNKDKLTIKLADFGLASYVKVDSLHNSYCGSPEYAAPEIISKTEYNPLLSDIWSIGVIIFCLVTSSFPWVGPPSKMISDILNYRPNFDGFDLSIQDNRYLIDLLSKIFVPANERINLSDIKNHPWICDYVLPSYLPVRTPLSEIKILLVDKLVQLGFDKKSTLESLYSNKNNQEVAIYHLLLNRFESNNTNQNNRPTKIKGKRDYSKSDSELILNNVPMVRSNFEKKKNRLSGILSGLGINSNKNNLKNDTLNIFE